jgi:uncharacterized membrane protein YfcA
VEHKVSKAVAVGLVAGTLSGLFGVGGGFIMVPLFVLWLGVEQKRAHATSLAAIIPIAVTAATGYALHREVDWSAGALVLAGSIFGANYGVRLLHRLHLRRIQFGFAALLIVTALRLLWPVQPHQLVTGVASYVLLAAIGFFAGVMAGLFGIGGGIVIVPALMLGAGLDAGIARGTSLAVIIGTSIAGTIAHRRRSNVDDRLALVTGLAGVPAAALSTYVVTFVPGRVILTAFAALLMFLAVRMLRTPSH